MKKLILAVLLCTSGLWTAQAQAVESAFGGVYRKVADPSEGENVRDGRIVVIFSDQGVWFDAFLARPDGHTAAMKPDAWVSKAGDGRDFSYNYVDETLDYSMDVKFPSDGMLTITDHFNAGGSPFGMGMTLGGDYELDNSYVADVNGYLYHYVNEATELELCEGGFYKGMVRTPESVSVGGKETRVAGVAAKAFWGNEDVTDVLWDNDAQYVGPSAFYRSGIHYYWENGYGLPAYVYPSSNFQLFVRQDKVEEFEQQSPLWMFFKHNYAPLTFVKDLLSDESRRWGYNPMLADDMQMQGVYYEMRVPDAVKKEMFRGYDPGEVIGLAVKDRFAAFHRFPPFSRWKWGEKEQPMSASLVKAMEMRYDRKVFQSRYIGHLREEDGRVGIFEFEPKNGEAMIVIAWTQGGKIKATNEKTTNIDPQYGGADSVWNVDDEGAYGIPELLCVAFDLHDNVILFFNHSAPESKNLYGLRQQGDQLQAFSEGQWYVYVD